MKKEAVISAAAALVFLLALGLTLYPLIASRYNEQHQSEIHTQYQEAVKQQDQSNLIAAKQLADEYNTAIASEIQLVDAFSPDALLWASEDYGDQLDIAGDGIMGYVEIPKIGVNLPILHGTSDATLELGIGHLLGSSLPVGGESTHAILTGHSGMANQKMFSDLPELEIGDVFYLEVLNETLAYQVVEIQTVLPYDTSRLSIVDGEDLCTLVTCTPFGVNTHRLLVRGSRIPYSEEEKIEEEQTKTEAPASTWERQYFRGILIGLGCCAALAAILLCVWCVRQYLRKRGGRYAR